MIPDKFTYFAPTTLTEAWDLLQAHPGEAKILAGGQSLIPLMKFRLANPAYLIDLRKTPGLDTLDERDGALVLGAMVREATLEKSPLIQRRYPGIHDASAVVADPLVRNFATIGGNLAHADPANDHPATMLALGASVVAVGPDGQRGIPVAEFFTDSTFETTLRPNEILTEIRLPAPTDHSGGAYCKLERKVGDYAIAGAAAYITLDEQGRVTYAGIGLTNVGPAPIKARNAEQSLIGKTLDDASIRQAADLAAAAAQPSSDNRGPAEYKRAMVHTLVSRALRKSLARATGGE